MIEEPNAEEHDAALALNDERGMQARLASIGKQLHEAIQAEHERGLTVAQMDIALGGFIANVIVNYSANMKEETRLDTIRSVTGYASRFVRQYVAENYAEEMRAALTAEPDTNGAH